MWSVWVFFFKQKTAYEMRISDWSSDVCSSDLIAGPVQLPGGFSILYVIDKRKILTSDPRDALLSLKQLSIAFPAGTTQTQATAKASAFATATRKIQGCGTANDIAANLGAEIGRAHV